MEGRGVRVFRECVQVSSKCVQVSFDFVQLCKADCEHNFALSLGVDVGKICLQQNLQSKRWQLVGCEAYVSIAVMGGVGGGQMNGDTAGNIHVHN